MRNLSSFERMGRTLAKSQIIIQIMLHLEYCLGFGLSFIPMKTHTYVSFLANMLLILNTLSFDRLNHTFLLWLGRVNRSYERVLF